MVVAMIPKQELLDLAADFGLAPNVVEKDYALGWMLAGFGQHPEVRDSWLFKGGTCLKKCFFETYRFSEDLDFTLTEPGQMDPVFLARIFQDVASWVYEQTGIAMPPEAQKVDVYTNPRGGKSAEGRIGYRGPLGRAGDAPRIKLDLTDDERVVLGPDRRQIHHPYSDRPPDGFTVATYCFEEVFAEKTRALAERLRPRDLYDVVHLYRRQDQAPERATVIATLKSKCEFKGIAVPTLQSIRESPLLADLRVSWDQMLAHQLPALPAFESFWNELPNVFTWLHETATRTQLPVVPSATRASIDAAWRPPAMAVSWRSLGVSAPLEIVRFAAANRLCVSLDYRDEQGRRDVRIIEPYSLRRTGAGEILLMAVKADSGEIRSYRADRIVGAAATQRSFSPRYQIEFTDAGRASIPDLERERPVSATASWPGATSRRRTLHTENVGGPTYTFRCTVCGKTFRRKSYDATLNPHKNKSGQPCYGSIGSYVKMEY
jgi:predicted nucleotidyltransferase component of viral defense system